jgi:hypothetical protein
MRYEKKMNRYERAEFQKKKLAQSLHGEGRYLFRNNTSGGLMLPKETLNGSRTVAVAGTFEGDSYFMAMVHTHELRLVREIEAPKPKGIENAIMNEQKLILDQPPTVNGQGTVEHHVVGPVQIPAQPLKPINEKANEPKDILITEDPLDGVDILID